MHTEIEITEDQLAIDWTLTDTDLQFIKNNSNQNIKFATQMCYLRAYGRFVSKDDMIPYAALSYLARQLGQTFSSAPVFSQDHHSYTQREKIRTYLGYTAFSSKEALQLEEWLVSQLRKEILDKKQLIEMAMTYLKSCRIVLPSLITLGRVVSQKVNQAIEGFHCSIAETLAPSLRANLHHLITPEHKEAYAQLAELRTSPQNANSEVMNKYLDYFEEIEQLGILDCNLSAIHPDVITELAQKGRYYDAVQLRDMASKVKQEAIIICFLHETAKTILDYIVFLFKRILLDTNRRAKNEISAEREKVSRKNKGKFKPASDFIKSAFSQAAVKELTLGQFVTQFNEATLLETASACEAIDKLESSGVTDHIVNRFSYIRQFSKRFLTLKLSASTGLASLLKSIELLRKLHAGDIKKLPEDVPTDFLPKMWKDVITDENGQVRAHHWEMGLYYALKKEISAGDLYLSKSRNNRYFWDTVYGELPWEQEREQQYLKLKLPNEFDTMMEVLSGEYHQVATHACITLPTNDFVSIKDGKFHFTKDDALVIPPEVVQLRKLIQSRMPKVRIEKLLAEASRLSGCLEGFTPFYEPEKTTKFPLKPLLAAILAHATNIGLFGMGSSAVGISIDTLTHASHVYLRPETIKETNRRLVNHFLTYPIAEEMTDGLYSTSDAQRYPMERKFYLSSYYPRYYGYYEKAISIYTHVSRSAVFGTQVISTGEREAPFVLTGLLENDTLLNPEFHSTDTHGFTEHLFAMLYLLGFPFHPRLKDLAEQNIYKIDKMMSYGDLDEVFSGTIDIELIRANWDQIVRIVASLKNGLAPAHVIIQKLANRTDNVSKAIRAFGRIIKSIYILRYIADQELRHTVHLHLNHGESRHQLAKKLFFLNRGAFKTSDYEEIMNKASCLSLVSNAVLVWNTYHIQQIVDELRAEGYDIPSEHLQKISPLMFKHIQIYGTYHFEDI
ncbi:TPA: Tn3 family transposase [Legionella pneumophila]|nr:Tn3 family transposase [Legionella pneumophila]